MPAPAPALGPSVAFDAVVKRYPGGTVAVEGVSVDITAGSFVALVGASGSGKSTLLKTVNRLVAPSAGRVLIDGAPVDAIEPHRRRRRTGSIFPTFGTSYGRSHRGGRWCPY